MSTPYFEIGPPESVDYTSPDLFNGADIHGLRNDYYSRVLPQMPDREFEQFLLRADERWWMRPNSPGSSSRRLPEIVVARISDGEALDVANDPVVGYAYTAQDASGHGGILRPLGFFEKLAKHHIDGDAFVASRHVWFRELIGPQDDQEFTLEMLALQSINFAHIDRRQPVTIYPWEGEEELIDSLEEWGLDDITADRYKDPRGRLQPLFPGSGVRVRQKVYEGKVGELRERLFAIDEVAEAVGRRATEHGVVV